MNLPAVSNWPSMRRWLIPAIVLLMVVVVLLGALGPKVPRHLHIDIQLSEPGVAQLFYATTDGFNEKHSIRRIVRAGNNKLDFILPFDALTALRFDPNNNDGTVVIQRAEACIGPDNCKVIPLASVANGANVSTYPEAQGLRVVPMTGTNDPQLLVMVPVEFSKFETSAMLWGLVLFGSIWLIVGLGCIVLGLECRSRLIIVSGMAVVTGLILALAVTSPVDRSASPDEFSHRDAYVYYLNHALPPAVDDPAVVPSLSGYGFSYLMEWDVVYWVAARMTAPFTDSSSNDLYAARGFSVALWIGLLLLALLGRGAWPWALSVMLLSPQVWYVFAYFNADAFPLVLALVGAGLIARRDDGVGQFIHGKAFNIASLIFVVALGLLLVSKRNFLPVLPAFGLWLVTLHLRARTWSLVAIIMGVGLAGASVQLGSAPSVSAFHGQWIAAIAGCLLVLAGALDILAATLKDATSRKRLWRVAILIFGAVLVATPRIGWDLVVNGSPGSKHQRIVAVQDARASHGYRPSDKKDGIGLTLAEQGLSLTDVVAGQRSWLRTSTESAFGVYGNMNALAPGWTHIALVAVFLSIFGLAMAATIRTSPHIGVGLCLLVVIASSLVALASLLHSWVGDFQAQGRYLLPILPILALATAHSDAYLPRRVMRGLLLLALLIGIYSFAFTAIPSLV